MTKKESHGRATVLQNVLKEKSIDGALLVSPMDVYYFSGTRQNAVLWTPVDEKPVLFVRKSVSRAKAESLIEDTRPFPSGRELRAFFDQGHKKIGMTFDVLPVQQYEYYRGMFTDVEFTDISTAVRQIRSVKSAWELDYIRKAGTKVADVISRVPEFLREGMNELELAAEVEYRLRRAGSEGCTRLRAFNQEIFQGLAISGQRASVPGYFDGPLSGEGLSPASSHGASLAAIRRNEPVMVDYTGTFNGYLVDMARTFVIGDLSPELRHAYRTAVAIQNCVADGMMPGAPCDGLFAEAVELAAMAGLADRFMGVPGENAKFVGHGVGLELDEFPVIAQGSKMALRQGNVIAIEPKFVFPGVGAVGLENTYVVGRDGCEKLTNFSDEIVCLK